MTRRTPARGRRALLPAVAVAFVVTLGLSACGSSTETAGAAMHTSVVQIAERSVAGDYAGALAELALLERDLVAAVEAGRVDPEQEQRIRAALELVRADLETAEAATTPAPQPEPEPAPAPADGGGGGGGDAPGKSEDKGKSNDKGKSDDKGNSGDEGDD